LFFLKANFILFSRQTNLGNFGKNVFL